LAASDLAGDQMSVRRCNAKASTVSFSTPSIDVAAADRKLCAERLAAFVAAGARRIFVWPLGGEVRQLELFREPVTGLVPRQP
jgi:hypothetical protein